MAYRYDYFPYNDTIAAEVYNNLYGTGNCVDQREHLRLRNTMLITAYEAARDLVQELQIHFLRSTLSIVP